MVQRFEPIWTSYLWQFDQQVLQYFVELGVWSAHTDLNIYHQAYVFILTLNGMGLVHQEVVYLLQLLITHWLFTWNK